MKLFISLTYIFILCGCRGSELILAPELTGHTMNSSALLVIANTGHGGVYGQGSATAIRWGGRLCVVTAWHVVAPYSQRRLLITGNGHTQWLGPFKKVKGRDLAWTELSTAPKRWYFLEVAENNKSHGSCTTWGFPDRAGALRSFRCRDNGWTFLSQGKMRWFAGSAIPGMSGGPIIDDDNRVIGIVSRSERPYTKVFYAAPVCDIVPITASAPSIPTPPPPPHWN